MELSLCHSAARQSRHPSDWFQTITHLNRTACVPRWEPATLRHLHLFIYLDEQVWQWQSRQRPDTEDGNRGPFGGCLSSSIQVNYSLHTYSGLVRTIVTCSSNNLILDVTLSNWFLLCSFIFTIGDAVRSNSGLVSSLGNTITESHNFGHNSKSSSSFL